MRIRRREAVVNAQASKVEFQAAHVVLTGNNNKVRAEVNYYLKQRYFGDNAKLRRAIQHDLEMLERYPDGKVRDELVASIEENTNKLIARGRITPQQVWTRRGIKITVALVVIIVVAFFGIAVTTRHTSIANGHPEVSSWGKWLFAAENLFGGPDLSPRGNPLINRGTEIPISSSLPDGKKVTSANVKLQDISEVNTCDPSVQDRVPHPKHGYFVRLDFEVAGGDEIGLQDVNLLARRNFTVISFDGKTADLGENAGTDCLRDAVLDGPRDIPRRSVQRFTLLADIPVEHGYLSFFIDPYDWPTEWAF
ncbi:hypothetical protein ACWDSJ_09110 [Nocardia sp. NPDC003482]